MFLNKHGSLVVPNPDIIVFGDISGSVGQSISYFNECRKIYDELIPQKIYGFLYGDQKQLE
jgi:hypothetical protein